MTNGIALLLKLLREPQGISKLSMTEWESVLRLARRANLLSRMAELVESCHLLPVVPAQVMPHLRSALVQSRHQRQAVIWEARHIGNALQHLALPIVLLKGAAYSMAGLKAAKGRLFGDVDILVARNRINEVEAALMLHGWRSAKADPYDDRYYRQWMHELPPMVNHHRGTVIDVHHNILPDTARFRPCAEKLLEACIPLPEAPFHVLSPCDMVIHTATHLYHEGELQNGLRDLFDLDALVTEFAESDPLFWDKLMPRSRELDLERPVAFAIQYLRFFIGTGIPDAVMDRVRGIAEPSWIFVFGLLPDHVLCNNWKTLCARSVIYLRGHYLRMPLHLLALHLGRKAIMRLYKNTSRES